MSYVEELKNKILDGYLINKDEALKLVGEDLDELTKAADELRKHFCGNWFDMCTIISGKNGHCSENCKFCAQSAHYHTGAKVYPLLGTKPIVEQAQYNYKKGVSRYGVVTSGKRVSDEEVDQLCETFRHMRKECGINMCCSLGLLNEQQFKKLRDVGVTSIHNNLETSRKYFPKVCTTHTWDEKVETIKAAQRAGLSVCSGGIMGIGESMEDRIDMALELRELGVKSVPVNFLCAIEGTPYEHNDRITDDEALRIIALYRFILPDAFIRLAGGRILLKNSGKKCFESGANATISGDLLTTTGTTIDKDMQTVKELGYVVCR
ncbi:biotin synthase BioB [Merdimonas faecis]